MKSFFVFLSRNKLYTTINLLGLTVSLAFIILLGAFVSKQLSTDKFQEKTDRIFLYANEEGFDGAYYLNKHLQGLFPEIEASTVVSFGEDVAHVYDNVFKVSVLMADSTFFGIFTTKTLNGNVKTFGGSINNIVISKSFANKVFGDRDPIGKTLLLESPNTEMQVVAVMENIGNSVLKDVDVIMRAEWLEKLYPYNNVYMSSWGTCAAAFLAKENADLQAKEPAMLEWLKENCWIYEDESAHSLQEARFIPLREAYFHFDEDPSRHINFGNRQFVRLLFFICLGLLFLAVMNYINLTVAQTGFRAKEMATRRLLGTSKGRIILKMILESTVLSAIAFVLAAFIAQWLSPMASRILEYPFAVSEVLTPTFVLLCLGIIMLLGLVSGIIPAILISKYKPIDVMKGSFRKKTKMIYSKVFITFQNVITVTMLIVVFVIFLQINHMINMPLNYNTMDIFVINTWESFVYDDEHPFMQQINQFKEELQKMPSVEAVGLSCGYPLQGGNNNTIKKDGEYVSLQILEGDSTFFNIMGIKVKKDNHLANPKAQGTYFLTEYAVKKLNITDDTPTITFYENLEGQFQYYVAGVYYDFKFYGALRENAIGLIANVGEYSQNDVPWNVVIKTQGDPRKARQEIEEAFHKVRPDGIMDGGHYYDDLIRSEYGTERQLLTLIGIFTLIALLISALGLLAMSTYYVRQEEKDVAIRKVFGSTQNEVLQRFVVVFMRYVLVAIVMAVPIGYYIMSRWLEQYIYRIRLSWWIFAVAALFTMLLAFLTVLWQSIRAAKKNPVESLNNQ